MVSRYSIVQYVPNPIADERINIGVLAFDDERVCVRFLSNWERVKRFGMEDIHFLKDFASRVEDAAADGLLFPGDSPNETPQQERLIRVAQNWFNSIQLTEPRGSLDDVESLLADIADTCLFEPPEKPKPRDRAVAASVAVRQIKNVLEHRFGDAAKELIHKNYPLLGSHNIKHEFDVVVANGKPYFAAQGLSFEVKVKTTLQNSISWKIYDVKELQPDFPLAIVTLPPNSHDPTHEKIKQNYEKITSMYSDLGADILTEDEVKPWVEDNLKKFDLSNRSHIKLC
ncbi:DUF3037 domain-containing protein [Coleofasciculus sp.]|uniref:DUF3037 domain-containing protein n=1 Tax=Coleofasciculus sp. TaxID=3100458 RepID=UPI0039FB2499